jgi:hypothetical protein
VVIAADGPTVAQVESFSLRTADGQVLEFRIDRLDLSSGGLPSGHLREHLVSGAPITVLFRDEDGAHVAIKYTDAAP